MFQFSLWMIIVHESTAEFTAQMLSLSYLNGDFCQMTMQL